MPRIFRSFLLLPILIVLGACAVRPATETGQPAFQHDYTGSAVPWTNTGFDDEEDKFTFALFPELTGKIPVNGDEICLERCVAK